MAHVKDPVEHQPQRSLGAPREPLRGGRRSPSCSCSSAAAVRASVTVTETETAPPPFGAPLGRRPGVARAPVAGVAGVAAARGGGAVSHSSDLSQLKPDLRASDVAGPLPPPARPPAGGGWGRAHSLAHCVAARSPRVAANPRGPAAPRLRVTAAEKAAELRPRIRCRRHLWIFHARGVYGPF